ncbi:MAG: hypothetical protein RL490_122 [Pseudomonadota bacterium]
MTLLDAWELWCRCCGGWCLGSIASWAYRALFTGNR